MCTGAPASTGHAIARQRVSFVSAFAHRGDMSSEPDVEENEGSLVGKTISGRYHVESLLGEGGMGAVYLVEHTLMHKRMALKVLHKEMSSLPEIVARFEREAMAASHIEHPNVAAATDFGRTEDGELFLVLEYIDGTSLAHEIRSGPLPLDRALNIARQIGSALVRAHELGIVHRDLKPDNVMLVKRGDEPEAVKVLDFGIAKMTGDARPSVGPPAGAPLTRIGVVFGTPEYMAPEQALGQSVDLRCDLYALGVILYEMLTGVVPFQGDEPTQILGQIVATPVPPMRTKAKGATPPEVVEGIVMRLLEKQASDRYANAREVLAALDVVSQEAGLVVGPRGPRGTVSSAAGVSGTVLAIPAQSWVRMRLSTLSVPRFLLSRLKAFSVPKFFRSRLGISVFAASLGLIVVVALLAFRPKTAPSVVTAARSDSVVAKPPASPSTASPETLDAAVAAGVDALEKLAAQFPEDASISRALVRAHANKRRHLEAMGALGKLLVLDSKAGTETDMQQAVLNAAVSGGKGADAAFGLMEGALGEQGVDMLYDLMIQKGPNQPKQRAAQALGKPAVRARASQALLILMDMKSTKNGCEAKRALLERAEKYGDERLLPLLKPLTVNRGCGFLGFGDCWSCMRSTTALRDAISAIESRGTK